MRVTVNNKAFADAISRVSRVVSTRQTLPILSNVKLEAVEGRLIVTGTDLQTYVTVPVIANVIEAGNITVNAKLLVDAVKTMADGDVELVTEGNDMTLNDCTKGSLTVRGLPASEYPPTKRELNIVSSFTADVAEIVEKIKTVMISVSTDETRARLTAVNFAGDDGRLTLVSTDTHRLSVVPTEDDAQGISSVLVPAGALKHVMAYKPVAGDNVIVSVTNSDVTFEFPDASVITMLLIDGEFPNHKKVIPKDPRWRVTVCREELIRALRMALVAARDDHHKVVIELDESSMSLKSESARGGKASKVINSYEVEVLSTGDVNIDNRVEFTIAMNGTYLVEGLSVITKDKVTIEFRAENQPVLIHGDGENKYVAMPMQLV